MGTNYGSANLITPPREEEEIYPYRRAWESVVTEMGVLLVIISLLFIGALFLGIRVPATLAAPVNYALALLPAALWGIFSFVREYSVPEPRERLLLVFIVSALVANAVGIPLVEDLLRPEEWLTSQSTVNRILGYAFTVGIVQELLKYIVIRYAAWPSWFRIRSDGVAYAAAAAIGYATISCLHFVSTNSTAQVDAIALRVLAIVTMNLIPTLVIGHGLSQTLFDRANVFVLAATLSMAAILSGFIVAFRSGVINAPLDFTISATRPLIGYLFTVAASVVPLAALYFLSSVAELRAQQIGKDAEA